MIGLAKLRGETWSPGKFLELVLITRYDAFNANLVSEMPSSDILVPVHSIVRFNVEWTQNTGSPRALILP